MLQTFYKLNMKPRTILELKDALQQNLIAYGMTCRRLSQ